MLILRVAEGIREHFPARKSEWFLSVGAMGWGVMVMFGPPDTFVANPAYEPLRRYTPDFAAPECWWGGGALLVGLVRFVALTINGTFPRSWYGRISPHVRSGMAAVTCFVWAQIAIGLWASDDPTTGRAIYPMLFALDLFNGFDALRDAADVDKVKRRGRTVT